ncbi:alpha-1,2-fucosyltransferase [Akkermansiaceae bacterium]|nr:alpha-1,2-fucosyltransferase [Akkermansiaceae bacterium]
MIRIVLRGRTGNNMFQYALGRALARKHGVPLVLDASWFNREGWSEVSHFLKQPLQAKVVRRFSVPKRALRKLNGRHIWEYCGFPVLKEPVEDQSFDPRIADAPSNCMLSGFFQTPLYFGSIAGELRDELLGLVGRGGKVDMGSAPARGIATRGTVAVHVRRGDYLHHPAFAVCDRDYYRASMGSMRERVPDARFFVFSDDPAWCRGEFRDADTEIVDIGSGNPLHDMHLMSLASHHIIANSSYSWWAAWLGEKPGQEVIMPERWFSRDIVAPISEKKWK